MSTRRSMLLFFGIVLISVWIIGFVPQVGAETLNYKFYTWVIRSDDVPVADVEGHNVGFRVRGNFLVFENGEVATTTSVTTQDFVKGSGSFIAYNTIYFEDGSTIILKMQGTTAGRAKAGAPATGGVTSEIVKGTGRFEGIKGTAASKAKYLPVIKGDPGSRGYGEGTMTFTLPSK